MTDRSEEMLENLFHLALEEAQKPDGDPRGEPYRSAVADLIEAYELAMIEASKIVSQMGHLLRRQNGDMTTFRFRLEVLAEARVRCEQLGGVSDTDQETGH